MVLLSDRRHVVLCRVLSHADLMRLETGTLEALDAVEGDDDAILICRPVSVFRPTALIVVKLAGQVGQFRLVWVEDQRRLIIIADLEG